MFGIFKKRESQADLEYKQVMDVLEELKVSVLLITQSGEIVMVADSLRSRPRDWLGGNVMEVMISRPGLDPYFIYYENDTYYYSVAGGATSLPGFRNYESYRSTVSQALSMYLVLYLMKTRGQDIRHPQMSFSHNRIHTNVIAYVQRLRNWYPIQHGSEEPEDATDDKVEQVNTGNIDIAEVIATYKLSPA